MGPPNIMVLGSGNNSGHKEEYQDVSTIGYTKEKYRFKKQRIPLEKSWMHHMVKSKKDIHMNPIQSWARSTMINKIIYLPQTEPTYGNGNRQW